MVLAQTLGFHWGFFLWLLARGQFSTLSVFVDLNKWLQPEFVSLSQLVCNTHFKISLNKGAGIANW